MKCAIYQAFTVAVIVLLFTISRGFAEERAARDLKKLQGTWVVKEAEVDEKEANHLRGNRYVFAGDQLTIHYKERTTGPFRVSLDPEKDPKWISYTSALHERFLGVYQVEAGKLKLAITNGSIRPKKLEAEEALFLILERQK